MAILLPGARVSVRSRDVQNVKLTEVSLHVCRWYADNTSMAICSGYATEYRRHSAVPSPRSPRSLDSSGYCKPRTCGRRHESTPKMQAARIRIQRCVPWLRHDNNDGLRIRAALLDHGVRPLAFKAKAIVCQRRKLLRHVFVETGTGPTPTPKGRGERNREEHHKAQHEGARHPP